MASSEYAAQVGINYVLLQSQYLLVRVTMKMYVKANATSQCILYDSAFLKSNHQRTMKLFKRPLELE